MPIELEKKYRLTEQRLAEVLRVLTDSSAIDEGEEFEENIIYGGGVLTDKNAVLRVRLVGGRAVLTYKKRLENKGDIKHQEEVETEVADAEAIRQIVAELGFKPHLVYEKRRHTWQFRSVEVVIDRLPFGLYMEVEGPVTGIREAEMLLDLDDLETENETYPRLTSRMGKRSGDVIEARF